MRTSALRWFFSILLALGAIVSGGLDFYIVSPTLAVLLTSWVGILGILPLCLMDLFQYQLFRRSMELEKSTFETSYDFLPHVQIGLEKDRPITGYIASEVCWFYISCLVILLLISYTASNMLFGVENLLIATATIVTHLLSTGVIAVGLRTLITIGRRIKSDLSFGNYDLDDSSQELKQVEKDYLRLLNQFNHYLEKILRIRHLASLAFLAVFSSISTLMAGSKDLLSVSYPPISIVICVIGVAITLILWRVDAFGYQKYVQVIFINAIKMENKHRSIPNYFHNLIYITKMPILSIGALIYYVYFEILLFFLSFSIYLNTSNVGGWLIFALAISFIFISVIFLKALNRRSKERTILSIEMESL
jgi:hypothetical protein